MSRNTPRIEANLPVSIQTKGPSEIISNADNISSGGILIRETTKIAAASFSKGEKIQMMVDFPNVGNINFTGKVIRAERDIAIEFFNLNEVDQKRLWQYIAERISETGECPSCGEWFHTENYKCTNCGWKLKIDTPDYSPFKIKEKLISSLIDEIYRCSNDQLLRISTILKPRLRITEKAVDKISTESLFSYLEPDEKTHVFINKVAGTDFTVLIQGEPGTGKEFAALAIHEKSSRRNKPFVVINCTLAPEDELERTLFGEKKDYMDPYTGKMGKIEQADEGTLLLYEFTNIPYLLQAKFLLFLNNYIVDKTNRKLNVRLIGATSQDLDSKFRAKEIHPDFYHMIKAFPIEITPVRDRSSTEKQQLADFFLKKFSREMGFEDIVFTKNANNVITTYSWPENINEMMSIIKNALIISKKRFIGVEDLRIKSF